MSGGVQDIGASRVASKAGASSALLRLVVIALLAAGWYSAVRGMLRDEATAGDQRAVALAGSLLADRIALASARAKSIASLLADDHRLKMLLVDIDERTVEETFEDLRRRTGASVLIATTPAGRVTAVVGAEELLGLDLSKTAAITAAAGQPAGGGGLWGWHDRVVAVSAGELRLADHIATIVVGVELGDADLTSIEPLAAVSGAIVVGDRIVARSAGADEGAIRAALALPNGTGAHLAGVWARTEAIGDSALPARAVWLRKSTGATSGLAVELLLFAPVVALMAMAAVGLGRRMTPGGAAVLLVLLAVRTPDAGAGEPEAAYDFSGAEPAEEAGAAEPVDDLWTEKPPEAAPVVGPISFSLLIDVGAFAPVGSGLGVVRDVGDRAAPELGRRYGWVFLGDLLSTAVNTRGEPADLGDLPGVTRADTIHAGDAMGFIVNQVSLGATARLGRSFFATAVIDFLPRSGPELSLGDVFAVDVAQLEWLPDEAGKWSVIAGKIEPVFGIEYRERRPNRRFGVTPSLIARYTTGTPVGARARVKLAEDRIALAVALTNGSTGIETFHFSSDTDTNSGKTVSGRASASFPLDRLGAFFAGARFEVGLSGLFGAQDHAKDSATAMWAAGADLAVRGVAWALKAELMRAHAPGRPEDRAYGLNLGAGGYVEAEWLFHPMFGVLVRGEARDATVNLGDERIYVTRAWRLTVGARAVVSANLVVKAEYLKNGELGIVPEFANDVFTSSLVVTL